MRLQQRTYRLGRGAEAIHQFFLYGFKVIFLLAVGQALVDHQPLMHIAAIGRRQQRRQMQIDLGGGGKGLCRVRLLAGLERAHRMVEHVGIQVETDLLHLAGLRFAQHFAGAADFQVMHGEIKARAQFFHHLDGFQAFLGRRGERILAHGQQIGIGLMVRAADATTQLVQLRQAEAIGAIDQDGVGIGNVDAGFDDGRAQQQVEALLHEVAHDTLQIAFMQLAMRHRNARFGQQRRQLFALGLDGFHFIVQKEHLTAALEFAHHRFADDTGRVGMHEGLDGKPALRRSGDHRQIAHAFERQRQGAWYGCGGEGQHIHLGPQLFQRFLLPHTEAVLLVHDHQTKAGEFHTALQQLVRADDDVDVTTGQAGHGGALFLAGAKARQLGNAYAPVGEAIAECLEMLLRQERGGGQYRHLTAVGHGNEGGAQRHLGLAKADITAHQPVHRLALGHITQHRRNGRRLIRRFLEAKALGKGFIVMLVETEAVTLARGALGIQMQQLGRGIAYLLGGARLGLVPGVAAQAMQWCLLRRPAGVAADQMQLRHWHIQRCAIGVFDVQELGAAFAQVEMGQALIATDAVLQMYYRVAGTQLGDVAQHALDRAGAGTLTMAARHTGIQLGFGQQRQCRLVSRRRIDEAVEQAGHRQAERRIAGQEFGKAIEARRTECVLRERLQHGLAPAGGLGQDQGAAGRVRGVAVSIAGYLVVQPGLELMQRVGGASFHGHVRRWQQRWWHIQAAQHLGSEEEIFRAEKQRLGRQHRPAAVTGQDAMA